MMMPPEIISVFPLSRAPSFWGAVQWCDYPGGARGMDLAGAEVVGGACGVASVGELFGEQLTSHGVSGRGGGGLADRQWGSRIGVQDRGSSAMEGSGQAMGEAGAHALCHVRALYRSEKGQWEAF